MDIILITLLTVIAALIGTATGFGTSTIMVPVLLLWFPLPTVLLLVGIIHWFGDVWKMLLFRSGIYKWKLILWFAIPGVVASYLGATISIRVAENTLLRILGGFLLGYVLFILFKKQWKLPEHNLTAGVGGLASGFSAGIFGVGGAIRSAFLSAFNLPKEVYIFTSGAMALVIDSTRIIGYVTGGTRLEEVFLVGLIVFIPASFVGAWLAKRVVDRIPQTYFRMFVAVFLAGIAVKFLIFP